MKVGSLVECIHGFEYLTEDFIIGNIHPVYKGIYTVRSIDYTDGYLIFEEIINPEFNYSNGNGEVEYNPEKFRELQPPIANIEEHINENTLEPVYI